MKKMAAGVISEAIQTYAKMRSINPAFRAGNKFVSIDTNSVLKELRLRKSEALVSRALQSKKFLETNGLRIVSKLPPAPGGALTLIYAIADTALSDLFYEVRGVAKKIFRELGGGEAFLQRERQNFRSSAE